MSVVITAERGMFVYDIAPIDHWDGWTHVDDFKFKNDENECDGYTFKQFNRDLSLGKDAARSIGWEGDMIVGPMLSGIPQMDGNHWPHIMIGWKQKNNGTTFILSPIHLPWLVE